MAILARSPRLQKLLVSAGTAGMVAAAVVGGYRYVARPASPPPAAAPLPPAVPVESAARCAGNEPVPGAAGAVCKRPAGDRTLQQPWRSTPPHP